MLGRPGPGTGGRRPGQGRRLARIVVAYRELCGWTEEAGYDFIDPEDIPNLFPKPLDRFDLSHLPTGGVFAPSLRPLSPGSGTGR